MPRQPYSVAVKSDRRSGYIPCPLRGKGLGKSGGAFLKGKEGRVDFRKIALIKKKDGFILEKTLCKTIREVEKINITKVSHPKLMG